MALTDLQPLRQLPSIFSPSDPGGFDCDKLLLLLRHMCYSLHSLAISPLLAFVLDRLLYKTRFSEIEETHRRCRYEAVPRGVGHVEPNLQERDASAL